MMGMRIANFSRELLIRMSARYAAVILLLLLAVVFINLLLRPTSIEESSSRSLRCPSELGNLKATWSSQEKWLEEGRLYPRYAPGMEKVLEAMRCAKIISADVANVGTQFKMFLTLDGGQKVLFKPKWYDRDHVIDGKVYDGKDRHNGEIFAFHLSLLFGFGRTPLAAGRVLDWETELKPVATSRLLKTVFEKDGKTCIVGECYYCTKVEAFCFDSFDGQIEGALLLWLPEHVKLKRLRGPWARTYKNGKMAKWEYFPEYCSKYVLKSPMFNGPGVKHAHSHELFLDFIDAAVFDYLILNGDRHRYELMPLRDPAKNATVILMDNGKSFGNPDFTGYDILAPLHQCCFLRRSTWEKLESLRREPLSIAVNRLAASDALSPLLSRPQLRAFDERFDTLKNVVEQCFHERGGRNLVLV